jgi:hypothetical protein
MLAKYHPDAHDPVAEATADAKQGLKNATEESKAKVKATAHGAKEALNKPKSVN